MVFTNSPHPGVREKVSARFSGARPRRLERLSLASGANCASVEGAASGSRGMVYGGTNFFCPLETVPSKWGEKGLGKEIAEESEASVIVRGSNRREAFPKSFFEPGSAEGERVSSLWEGGILSNRVTCDRHGDLVGPQPLLEECALTSDRRRRTGCGQVGNSSGRGSESSEVYLAGKESRPKSLLPPTTETGRRPPLPINTAEWGVHSTRHERLCRFAAEGTGRVGPAAPNVRCARAEREGVLVVGRCRVGQKHVEGSAQAGGHSSRTG